MMASLLTHKRVMQHTFNSLLHICSDTSSMGSEMSTLEKLSIVCAHAALVALNSIRIGAKHGQQETILKLRSRCQSPTLI